MFGAWSSGMGSSQRDRDIYSRKMQANRRTIVHQSYSLYSTHTHTRLTALCLGLPGWAGTRKVKPIWILLEQETVSGSGISWAIGSAHRSRQITTPAPHYCFFTGRMPFLPPNQQCQSTESTDSLYSNNEIMKYILEVTSCSGIYYIRVDNCDELGLHVGVSCLFVCFC